MNIKKSRLKEIYESLRIPDIKISSTNINGYIGYYIDSKPVINKLREIMYILINGERWTDDLDTLYEELKIITAERLEREKK